MLSDQYNIRAVGEYVIPAAQRLVVVTTHLSHAVGAIDYEMGNNKASDIVLRALPDTLVQKAHDLHPDAPATKILHIVPAFFALCGLNTNGTIPNTDPDTVPQHAFVNDAADTPDILWNRITSAQAFENIFAPFNRVSAMVISNHLRLPEIAHPTEIAHAVVDARMGIYGDAPESMQSEPVLLKKLSTWMPDTMNRLRERAGAPQIFNTLSLH